MIKYFISFLLCICFLLPVEAQITTAPTKAISSDNIEIIFDAGKGNKALFGHQEDVYFHAGLITSTSATDKDWKFVKGNWGKADSEFLMESLGGDKYKLILNIKKFFVVDSDVEVQQIAIVFRDAKGEIVAKTKSETDFLIPLNGYKPKTKSQDNLKYTKRSFVSYQLADSNLTIQTTQGSISFYYTNTNIIKAVFLPNHKKTNSTPSISAINQPGLQANFSETDDKIIWGRDDLLLEVDKDPFQISYYFKDSLLLKEELGFFEKHETSGVRFELSSEEAIYGTGERAVPLNRRGYKFDLYNRPDYNYGKNARNLNYTLPVILSSKKYMLFIDNYQKAYIDIAEAEENIMEFASIGGQQQYFIIAGDSYEDISSSFSKLVGHQPLPPRWALGNLQSRMAYRTQAELEGIVDKMIEKDFPLDAVIIDFYWFGDSIKGYLGNLKWYEKNWPQPEKMIADFKKKGVKTILITEPFVVDTSYWFEHADTSQLFATHENGETYILNDFYFGKAGLLDIFKPGTKDWFWEQYQKQIEIGVAGWWGDLGEPETHPSDMFHVNGKAEEVHNIYAHEWEAMVFNKYQEHYPNTRLFHLNRSGATGSQRYSIFPWSGDVSRSWSGLQAQLPLMLNMSMCGLAYISSDLGGFALGEKDEELYTRWLQMGVFNPVFRPHGSGIPSEPIFFSESTQNIVRESIKLRYRLMPYIYNAAYENTVNGKLIVMPLFYKHPENASYKNYSDMYYFGDEIIAAPVIERNEKEKQLLLPKGIWYDFYTDKIFEGGVNQVIDITLDKIPVFVKAGAFIPMLQDYSTTDNYPYNQLNVHYYPTAVGSESNYSLFEDDGEDAKNLENENYQIIDFTSVNEENEITLSLNRDQKKYLKNHENRRIVWIVHALDNFPKQLEVNGESVRVFDILQRPAVKNIDAKYDSKEKVLYINMPWNTDTITLTIVKHSK